MFSGQLPRSPGTYSWSNLLLLHWQADRIQGQDLTISFCYRTLTALAFFEGLAIHGQFIPGFRFIFAPNLIFTFPPEPWRLITPFFYIGGGLSFFFDLYFRTNP
jgi:hypothetical protein